MPLSPRTPADAAPAAPAPAVELQAAAFGYGTARVVREVDLRIEQGEAVAVLGPNGAGKSTLVRGLLGLTDHLSGRAAVLGQDLDDLDRRLLGYVPQRHTLSTSVRATVEEVVATGRLSHLRWWQRPGRADRAAIREALALVGLSDRARSDVATLSGGQQRRVLIARALASEPQVLVMDEPTAGVDAANQEVLAAVLHRLVERGMTLVVVTHELAALQGVVTRIVEVDEGVVAFDGSPEQWVVASAERTLGRHVDLGGHLCDDVPTTTAANGHRGALLPPTTLGLSATGPLDPGSAR